MEYSDKDKVRKVANEAIQKAKQGDMKGAMDIIRASVPHPDVTNNLGLGNVNRQTIAELVWENNPLAIITTEDLVRELTRREEVITHKSETDDSEYKIKVGGEVVEYDDGKATILLIKHREN